MPNCHFFRKIEILRFMMIIRSFQIKVYLYNKNGKFVEQYDVYISTLSAKKETNFKVT